MSFNGSGVFNRIFNWVLDAASGIDIKADRMDEEMNGFATGLSICLTRDGQAPMEANLRMGGFSIVSLKDPINNQEAATKIYVDTSVGTRLTQAQANDLYLQLLGGTLTGFLTLHAAPTSDLHAATKKYVDDTVPDFATNAEAIAGTVTDKVMSPALVQARQGFQQILVAGQTALNFNLIPVGFSELHISLNDPVAPANATIRFDFAGAGDAQYRHVRQVSGATYTAPIGSAGEATYALDTNTSNFGLTGNLHLIRQDQQILSVDGAYYRSASVLIQTAGRAFLNMADPLVSHFFRLNATVAFIGGSVTARWRM